MRKDDIVVGEEYRANVWGMRRVRVLEKGVLGVGYSRRNDAARCEILSTPGRPDGEFVGQVKTIAHRDLDGPWSNYAAQAEKDARDKAERDTEIARLTRRFKAVGIEAEPYGSRHTHLRVTLNSDEADQLLDRAGAPK